MKRSPVVAGQFYPAEKSELIKMLKQLVVKRTSVSGKLYGFLVPHAGYVYSGSVAGSAYALLSNQDKFVILGPNHFGIGHRIATYPEGEWITPLGEAKVDSMVSQLGLPIDDYAFQFEHSIEVQIPFLQYVVSKFSFIPIILQELSISEYYKLADIIVDLINKGYFLIISSDLNHYLDNDTSHRLDKELLDSYINDGFEAFLNKAYDMSACGFMAMAISILVREKLKGRFVLLDYKTSGDVTGEKDRVVGYASVAFLSQS